MNIYSIRKLQILWLLSVSSFGANFPLPDGTAVTLEPVRFWDSGTFNQILTQRDQIIMFHTGTTGFSLRSQMTPVKHQGLRMNVSSAFAAIAMVDWYNPVDLSEQCLISWAPKSLERPDVSSFLNFIESDGIPKESQCPYNPVLSTVAANISDFRFRESASHEIYPMRGNANPIDYLRSRLLVGAPVAVRLFAVGISAWQQGAPIYPPTAQEFALECGFSRICGSQWILVTGINDIHKVVEFKNSWGNQWGIGGYGYMSYEYFLTYINSDMISF